MEKFMLIVREDLKKIGQYSLEERFARSPDMLPWLKSITEADQYIMGHPL